MEEFSRTELLIGAAGQEKLSACTVAVFGIGGVGSHCIEALARCGIGHLALIDSDTVSLSNINRQSIACHSTVGEYKTRVMRDRIYDINPAARVDIFETFVLPDNLDALLDRIGPVDYLVDAIDTVTAKLAIAAYAEKHHIPLIASMGTGNKLHAELFEIADITQTSVCPLCRVMRRELKNRGIGHLKVLYSKEPPITSAASVTAAAPVTPSAPPKEAGARRAVPGSISFVPPVAGLLIAGETIRDLLGL